MPIAMALSQFISSIGFAGSSPLAHSVALSTPPPSQSIAANADEGFNTRNSHIVMPVDAMLSQLISSAGAIGLVGIYPGSGVTMPVMGSTTPPPGPKHSVKLSTPPPSQSSVPSALVGFEAKYVHKSNPDAMKFSQLSSIGSSGLPPAAHSAALSPPPLSQSKAPRAGSAVTKSQ